MVGVEVLSLWAPMNSDIIEYAADAPPNLIAKIPCGNKIRRKIFTCVLELNKCRKKNGLKNGVETIKC